MNKRPAMTGSEVRKVVAPALREAPAACGIVTITKVEVSPDCAYATVFISALQESELALAYLKEKRDEFQKGLFRALTRFRVPEIRFRIDTAGQRAERLDRLLSEEIPG